MRYEWHTDSAEFQSILEDLLFDACEASGHNLNPEDIIGKITSREAAKAKRIAIGAARKLIRIRFNEHHQPKELHWNYGSTIPNTHEIGCPMLATLFQCSTSSVHYHLLSVDKPIVRERVAKTIDKMRWRYPDNIVVEIERNKKPEPQLVENS